MLICICKSLFDFIDCSMLSKKIVNNSMSIKFDAAHSMLKNFVRLKNRFEQKNKIDESIVEIVQIVEIVKSIDVVKKKIFDVLIN